MEGEYINNVMQMFKKCIVNDWFDYIIALFITMNIISVTLKIGQLTQLPQCTTDLCLCFPTPPDPGMNIFLISWVV